MKTTNNEIGHDVKKKKKLYISVKIISKLDLYISFIFKVIFPLQSGRRFRLVTTIDQGITT